MAQSREPNEYDRQLRHMNRRLERLEDTQVSPQEFERAFNRVYEEIDELKIEVREVKEQLRELNNKFDIIMRHITGQGS